MGEAVNRQLKRRRRVVLDLENVDFMDLHGLAVLMRSTRRARSDGGSFAIPARRPACGAWWGSSTRSATSILPDGSDPLDAA